MLLLMLTDYLKKIKRKIKEELFLIYKIFIKMLILKNINTIMNIDILNSSYSFLISWSN